MAAADTPHLPDGAEDATPDRRAVLRGMSAMGLAAVAAPFVAFAGDRDNSAAAAVATDVPTDKKPPKPKKGAKLVKASNTPLANTADIPANSGMLFESDEYIVTQPKAGKFVGFDSLCTHEGCPVDVFDTPGEMDCSCHGARYSLADGKVLSGPAKKPLPKKPILVENGKIYKAKPAK